MRKFIFSTLISTISILYLVALYKVYRSEEQTQTFTSITEKGELVVAIDENQPGYFMLDSLSYGFDYTLLEEFCKSKGLRLTIVPAVSSDNTISMLNSGKIDMACTINTALTEKENLTTHILGGIYSSNFVILSNKSHRGKLESTSELKEAINGKSVIMPYNFTTTKSYDMWLDSLSNSAMISYESPSQLISQLSEGRFDFLVCNKTDAMVGALRDKNVKISYQFDEIVSSVLLVRLGNYELEEQFNNWMEQFVISEQFASLTAAYSSDKFIKRFIKRGINAPMIGGISIYDDIIREKSDEMGYDWRLVSAIAYHESRFNPDIRSKRGATGIMQVMPKIARHFGSSEEAIVDPSTNIEVALKLLKAIEKSLKLPSNLEETDRISIILACYNGGVGHVIDARNLARKYGEDPNDWDSVSYYLKAKSQENFYTDVAVKNGKFLGTETIAFVDKVMTKYDQYCDTISKD